MIDGGSNGMGRHVTCRGAMPSLKKSALNLCMTPCWCAGRCVFVCVCVWVSERVRERTIERQFTEGSGFLGKAFDGSPLKAIDLFLAIRKHTYI